MTIWKIHAWVMGALATLVLLLTVLVWLHPTLGYAPPGSIIAGADLRGQLLLILWLMLVTGGLVATLAIAVVRRYTERRVVIFTLGYGMAIFSQISMARMLDRFF